VLLNQDENTNSFVKFCKDNYIDYAIQYSAADTIKNYCLKNNKIGITIELNGKNYIDTESSEIGASIILTFIMHDLEIKKSVPKYNVMEEVKTYHEGLFIFNKECGNIIKEGDYIGYVLNLNDFSETKIYFTKPGSYRMICRDRSDYVSANKIICMVQPLI
jgi:predicted deacylase